MFASTSFERSITEEKNRNRKIVVRFFAQFFPFLAQCARGYWHEGEAHISSFSLPRGKMYPAF